MESSLVAPLPTSNPSQLRKRKALTAKDGTTVKKKVKKPVNIEEDDEIRHKTASLICRALQTTNEKGGKEVNDEKSKEREREKQKERTSSPSTPQQIGERVEHALYEIFGGERPLYSERARFLVGELRLTTSQKLRSDILNGTMTVYDFVVASSSDLACDELKQQREETEAKNLAKRLINNDSGSIESNEFRCPKCHTMKTRIVSLYSRRDIGKSETWGNKDVPSSIDIVTCVACNFKWKMEGS